MSLMRRPMGRAGSEASDGRLLRQADHNFAGTWQRMLDASPNGRSWRADGALCTDSGHPISSFNTAFVARDRPLDGHSIASLQAPYLQTKTRYRLCVGAAQSRAAADLLRSAGLRRSSEAPLMALKTDGEPSGPRSGTTVAGLRVAVVAGSQTLEDFRVVAAQAYQIPSWLAAEVLTAPFMLDDNVQGIVGYVADQPVTAAMVSWAGGVAGIYWVGTITAARGKGYGDSITRLAVAAAGARTADWVVLQASAMGEPLYRRMGFVTSDAYVSWVGGGPGYD